MPIKPTPETTWKRPAYLPYVHSPLDDDAIKKCNKELGFELPESYLAMLRIQNGGPIRFRIPDSVGYRFAGIGKTFPCIPNNGFHDNQEYVDFPLSGLVPFDGDGHWFLCLDYRGGSDPSVAYVDVECNSEHQMASSFSELFDRMELNIDDEHVVTNVDDIADAREKLGEAFGIKCERKMNNIGVENSFFKSADEDGDCFWVSPNSVAAGFSGDAPKFAFEGSALVFPELSDNAVIFHCPNGRVDEYKTKMSAAGFDLIGIEESAANH